MQSISILRSILLLISFGLIALVGYGCDDDPETMVLDMMGGMSGGSMGGTIGGMAEGGTNGVMEGDTGGMMGGETGGMMGGETGGMMGGATGGMMEGETGGMMADQTLSGLWLVRVKLVDVGGLETDLQFEITASETEIQELKIRAASQDQVSDLLATLNNLPIVDGQFEIELQGVVLPQAFSPSGSDVELDLTLSAQQSETGFCGSVVGSVVTLDIALASSTFGAVRWEEREGEVPVACEQMEEEQLPRLTAEECPDFVAGVNTFESGGYMRTVDFILPSSHTTEMSWPIVYLWHGFTSSVTEIKDLVEMEELVETEGFILAVPSSRGDAGLEWDSLSAGDNPDLTFFDDLVTCSQSRLNVDPQRVHITGFSGGGLWTAYLSVFRSNIIASAVGMSSGLIPNYPNPDRTLPYLAAWGGETDLAFDQDFTVLAQSLISTFLDAGHFVMECNHNQAHEWLEEFSPWVIRFLLDHPFNLDTLPYEQGLPEGVYPEYCSISQPAQED